MICKKGVKQEWHGFKQPIGKDFPKKSRNCDMLGTLNRYSHRDVTESGPLGSDQLIPLKAPRSRLKPRHSSQTIILEIRHPKI